jgi:chromosome segregation ATPase
MASDELPTTLRGVGELPTEAAQNSCENIENIRRCEQLAAREQRLADREAAIDLAFQQFLEREQRLADRDKDVNAQWKELKERDEQWRARQRTEQEELDVRFAELDEKTNRLREEEERTTTRLKAEEERLKEVRKQLDERKMRWMEACREANAVTQHVAKPRLTPRDGRSGKENVHLQKQLEEQANHMNQIKRQHGSWGEQHQIASLQSESSAPEEATMA